VTGDRWPPVDEPIAPVAVVVGGAPVFVGIELLAHAVLALRGRPSFYRGDG
jgi:hypothetical protein